MQDTIKERVYQVLQQLKRLEKKTLAIEKELDELGFVEEYGSYKKNSKEIHLVIHDVQSFYDILENSTEYILAVGSKFLYPKEYFIPERVVEFSEMAELFVLNNSYVLLDHKQSEEYRERKGYTVWVGKRD